jgi:voltage-gated potassium channel
LAPLNRQWDIVGAGRALPARARKRVAMSAGRRLALALGGIVALSAFGTVGYVLFEHMSLIDALYMTVITISTVGFGEVKPLDSVGRIFTMGLIVVGVGNAFYLFAVVAELLVEGRLREYLGATAMHRKIHDLKGHVIICGFGRFGRVVAEELLRNAIPIVVIDSDPAKGDELERLSVMHLVGDALRDDVLEDAGIRQARAIVVGTASDPDNVYVTLSAREKNPSITIHSRGESEAGMRRLRLAGADQVISAYQRGGMRVAATILRPSVIDFLELSTPGRGDEIDLEEIRVAPHSPLVGKEVGAIENETPKLRIVALKRGTEPISIIPDPGTLVRADDVMVVIGSRGSLKQLAAIVEV